MATPLPEKPKCGCGSESHYLLAVGQVADQTLVVPLCDACLDAIRSSYYDTTDHFLHNAKRITDEQFKRRLISRHEAAIANEAILDLLARHYLAVTPSLTAEALAEKLGCSPSRAKELPAWLEHQDKKKTTVKVKGSGKNKRQKNQVGLGAEPADTRSGGDWSEEDQQEWEQARQVCQEVMTPGEKRKFIDFIRKRMDNA